MQHIVIITTSFPQSTPGAEAAGSFVYDFAIELTMHTRVTVIAPGDTTAVEQQESITVNRFAVPMLPLSLLSIFNPCHWYAIYRTMKAGMDMTRDLLKSEKYDYIFALWALPSGYWARKVLTNSHIKYAVWALGSDIWKFKTIPFTRSILRKVLIDADQCFADGYLLKSDVETLSGRTCHFLPSARKLKLDEQYKKREAPPYRLAFLGRWHANKGIDLLLESLGRLNENDWKNIEEVRIYGGGPLEPLVRELITGLKLHSRPVIQGGYLSKEDAIELIRWADYLLIPSRIESIPVVFSDAMQCRTPVVAMPVGDLPELIPQNNVGIVADEVTSKAYTSAIKRALTTSSQNYNRGMDLMCEKFKVENIVNQFLAVINNSP